LVCGGSAAAAAAAAPVYTAGQKGNTGHPLPSFKLQVEGGQYEGLRNVKVI
jgi:hypothetical protein